MDRNLALEFVRVTESAAIAAARWLGRGDKKAADQAAVTAMRNGFNSISFRGTVVIGEGEKDEAPMLYTAEKLGVYGEEMPEFDIAVDPLEGTTLTAEGRQGAISVIAFGPKGTLFDPPGTYMDQLSVGAAGRGKINILDPLEENIRRVAEACHKTVQEFTVAILLRDRNQPYIDVARKTRCRVVLFDHGTVAHGLAPAIANWDIDMMAGIGGAPEAVITASGLKCLGGDMQAVLKPHNEHFRKQALEKGLSLDRAYTMNDLVKGDALFVATGVSTSPILRGVSFGENEIITHSIVMRSETRVHRLIESHYSE